VVSTQGVGCDQRGNPGAEVFPTVIPEAGSRVAHLPADTAAKLERR